MIGENQVASTDAEQEGEIRLGANFQISENGPEPQATEVVGPAADEAHPEQPHQEKLIGPLAIIAQQE
jgi:hypothetical protein